MGRDDSAECRRSPAARRCRPRCRCSSSSSSLSRFCHQQQYLLYPFCFAYSLHLGLFLLLSRCRRWKSGPSSSRYPSFSPGAGAALLLQSLPLPQEQRPQWAALFCSFSFHSFRESLVIRFGICRECSNCSHGGCCCFMRIAHSTQQ